MAEPSGPCAEGYYCPEGQSAPRPGGHVCSAGHYCEKVASSSSSAAQLFVHPRRQKIFHSVIRPRPSPTRFNRFGSWLWFGSVLQGWVLLRILQRTKFADLQLGQSHCSPLLYLSSSEECSGCSTSKVFPVVSGQRRRGSLSSRQLPASAGSRWLRDVSGRFLLSRTR